MKNKPVEKNKVIKIDFKFKNPNVYNGVSSEDCSSHIVKQYTFNVSKYGEAKVIDNGEFDIYKYIQTFKDQCDLKLILDQVRVTGDESLLHKKKVVYGDSSSLPKTFVDAHNMLGDAYKNLKEKLSKESGIDFTSMSDKDFSSLTQEKLQNLLLANLNKKLASKTAAPAVGDINNE